jgi:hypothetical protein
VKRIPAILILTILVANTAGFYVYYAVQLRHIHSEMRYALKFLPDDQLTILRLTKETYEISRVDDHEVKIHGKMYDIARIEIKKDSVIIAALHDEKEDNLIALLGEIVSKPLKDDQPVPSSVIQFIALNFLLPSSRCDFENSYTGKIFYTPYSFSEITFMKGSHAPPPRPEMSLLL